MNGFIDLHCHWVAGIDDGARVPEAGVALLRGLHQLGFSTVVATPHMRPGMFDNDRPRLTEAFEAMRAPLASATASGTPLPEVHLASEHWFDDTVFERLRAGQGLPYPSFTAGKKSGVLVEFAPERFPLNAHRRFFDLHRAGLFPVIAHPERYQPVWSDRKSLHPFVEAGAYLLLDVCSLVGKYGKAAQRAAEQLFDDDAYLAACSDAHKPEDLDDVARAIERLRKIGGDESVESLLVDGPRAILHRTT
jgi:protein-tyrosine phosphatase